MGLVLFSSLELELVPMLPYLQSNTTLSGPALALYRFRIIEALCAAMIHDPSTGLCLWVSVSTIVGSWSLSIKRPMT
jgi:hypothetical protein